ncbi:esterase E4 isoform X1 [Diabrotica virgifera virgifera]|uniref:Carboxylic ester hydrolase n=1 Tax=Diabrotica virgifera virgifera TaxID=50390 RepID=A0ABM5ITG4_DIAVI|nr:esterase E4 isoform X1 [Diabrotica virgifera virgifera]
MERFVLCFIIFPIIFIGGSDSCKEKPIIKLSDGSIQGIRETSNSGKPYYAFREIPYAEPPIGELRFSEPISPKKWKGVKETVNITKICLTQLPPLIPYELQYYTDDKRENEDCLYLNVFTPQLPYKENITGFPVYVYIYGGFFIYGNPTGYDFQYLVDEGVVVVSFNYRMNSLGFLSTEDNVFPANLGLKDQLMVLKWVNKNIELFGGDPTKVTLGGHSAGAILTGYHLLSKKSKGLFRSAIVQSGTPLMSFGYIANPRKFAFMLGEKLSRDFHSSMNTSQDLLKLLRSLPGKEVAQVNLGNIEGFDYKLVEFRSTWAPTKEDPNYEHAFLTDDTMHENFKKGHFNQVPVMIGITDEEFKDYGNLTRAGLLVDSNYSLLIDPVVPLKKENILPMVNEIKNIYCNTNRFAQNATGMAKILSDILYGIPIMTNAKLMSKYTDVYFYQFGYLGPINGINFWKQFSTYGLKGLGNCAHGDELPLLYDFNSIRPVEPPNSLDILVRKRLVKLWVNFIKYGNPTPEEDPLLLNITWQKMTPTANNYFNIDAKVDLKKNMTYFNEWLEKVDKYFENPRRWY